MRKPPHVSRNRSNCDHPRRRPGQTAAPRRKRGEGQWALGYREPLNKNEENKKNDDGLNVRQRIIDIYAKHGFDSIDPADLRGRMRWYGLYTQRRPGIDGGKTAVLEPEELDDRYFMLRVRIDGGQLSAEQLRVISDISVRYARGTADVTDRQNIQLHWIEIESVPAIWEALEAVGLSTTEACGDTPRVILGCPLAGLDADELIDATPEIAAVAERYIGDPALSNLPRKFKSSISGCAAQCTHHEINDVAFAAVRHPETGEVGYDLWVGGGLSTNPMIAKRLGAFVRPGQVPEVWAAVAERLPRLRLPAAAAPGQDQVPHRRLGRRRSSARSWRRSTSGTRCPTGPPRSTSDGAARDHVGVHRQRDGLYYVGFAPARRPAQRRAARPRSPTLAERYGSGRVRTTAEQKMVILDVPDASVHDLVAELDALGLPVEAERLPAAHDGLHRDRVLQARDRGDQGPGDDADRRARAAAARLRRAGHHQRQRLPELLRPHPDRRHRPQGVAGDRRRPASRSRGSRSTSAAR